MFFFKKPKIVVDAFTYMGAAYELFKVAPAGKMVPEWWKQLSSTFKISNEYHLDIDTPTMKTCIGFTELYKNGFVIPLWSDIIIETAEGGFKYQWANDQCPEIRSHDTIQMGHNFNHMIHAKFQSPWIFHEKTGVDFVWTEPSWNLLQKNIDLRILPGVTNYQNQTDTHINIFVPNRKQRIELEAGTPLVHLIPISDKKVEIKHHLIDKEEFLKKSNHIGPFKFRNSYRTMLKIKEENQSKCPFGFK